LTIIRNRGVVVVKPQSFGADVDVLGAFGVGIVSAEAFAAGVASVPSPYLDADWAGWMVWRTFAFHFEFASALTIALPANISFEVDSKAMRKIGPNEVLVYVAESQAGALSIFDGLRTLIKLS